MPTRHRPIRLVVAALSLVGVALLGLAVAGALYVPNTAIPAGFPGRQISVDGLPLRVLQVGSGPDMLLIHGSPGSIEDWTPVIEALSGSFRLTAFDRPGHGFSGDTGEYSFEYNAEVAEKLIETLGLENAVVVGHSYGGTTALALALRQPEAVGAYVIVDSATYTPSRQAGALYRVLALPWLGTGVGRALGSRAEGLIERGLVEQFEPRSPPAGFAALRTQIWSSPKVTHALAAETVGASENLLRLSPHYPEIRRPVFVVAQAEDEFRRTTAERLNRDVAGSVLRLVPETGHFVQIEQPAAVVDAIRQAANAAR